MPFPVELEADPPLTVLPLVPTIEGHPRHLLVYRDHIALGTLRLTERVVSSTSSRDREREYNYTFSILKDIAVPLYTVKQESQPEWAMQVICHGKPLVFSFANRKHVLNLQRFITGYEVKDSFFGAETLLDLKSSWKKFKHRPKSEHHGITEMQLWEWPDEPRGTTQLPTVDTASCQIQTPPASIAPSEMSLSDVVTVQTDRSTGRQAIVTELTPPPLLVMFLQESNRCTMLGIQVTHIKTSKIPRVSGWLEVLQPLEVNIHSVHGATEALRSWNLCSMAAANILDADIRKCDSLHIKFENAAEIERFENALEECRQNQAVREGNRVAARDAALSRIVRDSRVLSTPYGPQSPVSPRSSGRLQTPIRQPQASAATAPPPTRPPQPPLSGPRRWSTLQEPHTTQYSPMDRVPLWALPSQSHHQPRSVFEDFASLSEPMMTPAVQELGVVSHLPSPSARHQSIPEASDTDHVKELDTGRRTGEVHGDSLPLQELPESAFKRWGGRRHEFF